MARDGPAAPGLPAGGLHRRFPASEGAVPGELARLGAALRAAGASAALAEGLLIVLAEVLNNIEEHAYAMQAGGWIELWLVPGPAPGTLAVTVEDAGLAMPGGRLPGGLLPEIDPGRPERWPEGGYGWGLVRRLTRELGYERRDGRNRVRFVVPG